MSWPDTIGYPAGQGQLQTWLKVTHTPTEGGTTLEFVSCGVSLPIVTTSPLLDGARLSNDIPIETFDRPSMPRLAGSTTWSDGRWQFQLDANVVGTRLDDPSASWPPSTRIVPFDHDADGKPGITAIPREGDGFTLPPTDLGQTQRADAVYLASRLVLALSASELACETPVDGEAEPIRFDYTILGCHARDRGECEPGEASLLDNNKPAFVLGEQGSWTSVPITESAACGEVVAALPAM